MSSIDSSRPRAAWWCRLLKWYAIVMGFSALVLAIAVVNAVTLSRDARLLRDVIAAQSRSRLEAKVQISADAPSLALAQGILHFIHDAPQEARVALGAVERASVGVYTLRESLSASAKAAVLNGTNQEMSRRGWTRAVGVLDGKQCISIFVRASRWSTTTQEVCLSVCDDRQVVVVSGRADAAALAYLVRNHAGAVRL